MVTTVSNYDYSLVIGQAVAKRSSYLEHLEERRNLLKQALDGCNIFVGFQHAKDQPTVLLLLSKRGQLTESTAYKPQCTVAFSK